MPPKESRVEIEIAGELYVLKGEAPPEHIERVARLVHQKIKEARLRNQRLPLLKAAVVAALNIADEYLRLEEDHENLVRLIEAERGK